MAEPHTGSMSADDQEMQRGDVVARRCCCCGLYAAAPSRTICAGCLASNCVISQGCDMPLWMQDDAPSGSEESDHD
jgi:hypothetical protein